MRHNNKINHLGRTHAHREAMLSNMAVSLIKHKRIFTTLAKAKELRKYVEPLITKSKDDSTHSRRIVFKNLRDKYAVTELFNDISQKIGDRPGGYTRIIKIGNRLGDNASTCFIELVDYNELMLKDKTPAKSKTRRSRRSTGKGATETTPETEVKAATKKAPKTKPVEEIVEAEKIVETVEEVKEEPVTETPVAETETETAAPAEESATEEEAPKNE
jgi:large subunit ribosomal protein L17